MVEAVRCCCCSKTINGMLFSSKMVFLHYALKVTYNLPDTHVRLVMRSMNLRFFFVTNYSTTWEYFEPNILLSPNGLNSQIQIIIRTILIENHSFYHKSFIRALFLLVSDRMNVISLNDKKTTQFHFFYEIFSSWNIPFVYNISYH